MTTLYHRCIPLLIIICLITASPALALFGIGESKEMDEKERQETIERIEDVQQKLKLLQDKLKALERRKAAKEAAKRADQAGETTPEGPLTVNWLPVDSTVTNPGDFGLYTYLLFNGSMEDTPAVGSLEDLILTLETLPPCEVPEGLANRFLLPVERPQSAVDLGEQPYDFQLSRTYLDRLQLRDSLPKGPILVSLRKPLDPYGQSEVPAFMAVSLGRQKPGRALELAKIWHDWEKEPSEPTGHPVASLFWAVLDESGTSLVTRFDQRLLLELPVQP
jgi:hypothetical protein